jgi:hypothetical protein
MGKATDAERKELTMTRKSKTQELYDLVCTHAREYGSVNINVTWHRNRTWGNCPRLEYNGQEGQSVTGCGFDKLSTVLANALGGLSDSVEGRKAIEGTAAAGLSATRKALEAQGWGITTTASGQTFDCFEVRFLGAPL